MSTASEPRAPAIDLQDVCFAYDGVTVLKDVTLRLEVGEHLGLIGPNGGGKTTLLKVILGLLKPSAGTVQLFGGPVENARRRIGYVPQRSRLNPDLPSSVLETVLLGRLPRGMQPAFCTTADQQAALEILDLLGMADRATRPLDRLSGGELQRVLIARALVDKPELVLLDEPATHVDPQSERDLLALLRERLSGMGILLVTHNVARIAAWVPRIAHLNETLRYHDLTDDSRDELAALYA